MRRVLLLIVGCACLATELGRAQAIVKFDPCFGVVCIAPGTDIQSVIDDNDPGTTYLLTAGTHRMQSFTPQSGDTFRGEIIAGAKVAMLDGSRHLETWVEDGDVWYHAGQTQGGDLTGAAEDCLSTYLVLCRYPEDLFLNGFLITRSATLMAMTEFQWFFDYAADRIYVGFDPTAPGSTIETSVTRKVIATASGADNVTFKDLVIEQYATPNNQAALQLGASSLGGEFWVADNIEGRRNHSAAIWNDTNSTTRNGYFHHNGIAGLLGSGTNILVEDNEIAYNAVAAGFDDLDHPAGFDPYWTAGGTKWVVSTGLIVRRNYAHHNYGAGLWTDVDNLDCLYQNNISSDNLRSGIYHEVSYDCVIDGNTLERNGLEDTQWGNQVINCGIEILSSPGLLSTGIEVKNNIVTDNWHGICVRDDTRNVGLDDELGGRCDEGCDLNVINVSVHNNTITQASSGTGGLSGFQDAESDGYDGDGNSFTFNTYCLSGSDTHFFSWDDDDTLTSGEWQATGNDAGSTFTC